MKSIRRIIVLAALIPLTLLCSSPAIAAEEHDDFKCHGCKETDLNLVERHNLIGFNGCYDCHEAPVEKKPAQKEKDKDDKKEG